VVVTVSRMSDFGEEIAYVSFDTTMSVVDSQCRGHFVSRRLNKVRTKSRGQQSFASAVPLPGTRFRMLRHITTSSRNRAVTLPQLYSSFWSRIDPGYQASQHAYRSIATLLYFIHHAKPTHAFQFVFFSQPQFSP
jgi:hypothetical protein